MKIHQLVPILVLSTYVVACGDDDAVSTPTSNDAGTQQDAAGGGGPTDGGTTPDASDAATVDDCAAATVGLAASADANAPALDGAKSSVVRVESNDASCAAHGGAFGGFGYQLSLFSSDGDGDGRTSLDDVQADGAVRLASSPNIQIMTRTDPKKFSTGGQAIIIQLCLDKVYGATELTVGADLSDKAGHRAKAICIRQQSGR